MTIPQGFVERPIPSDGFITSHGPVYVRTGGRNLSLGTVVADRHCDDSGHCGNGALSAIIDLGLALGVAYRTGAVGVVATVSLSCNFIKPVPAGAWVQGEIVEIEAKQGVAHVLYTVRADGERAAFARAIMAYRSEKAG